MQSTNSARASLSSKMYLIEEGFSKPPLHCPKSHTFNCLKKMASLFLSFFLPTNRPKSYNILVKILLPDRLIPIITIGGAIFIFFSLFFQIAFNIYNPQHPGLTTPCFYLNHPSPRLEIYICPFIHPVKLPSQYVST